VVQHRNLEQVGGKLQPTNHHRAQGLREGRLQTRSWEDPQGQKHYRTEVVANTVLLLDSRPKPPTPEGEEGAAAATAAATGEEVEPADIPF